MVNAVPVKPLFFFAWAALMFLSACQGMDSSVGALAIPPAEADEGAMDFPLTLTPTLPPTPTAAEPQAQARTELIATDPDTVELASGQVQLIEFFAFW